MGYRPLNGLRPIVANLKKWNKSTSSSSPKEMGNRTVSPTQRTLRHLRDDGETRKRWTVILPIPMPTWNRILQMHPMQRKTLRHLIHECVLRSITEGSGWLTRTGSASKQLSMDLWLQRYLQTIRPSKSRKSAISKLRASLKKLKS